MGLCKKSNTPEIILAGFDVGGYLFFYLFYRLDAFRKSVIVVTMKAMQHDNLIFHFIQNRKNVTEKKYLSSWISYHPVFFVWTPLEKIRKTLTCE